MIGWDEYPRALGARLRWHRECAELSLGELEVASGGRFRAVTVGTWERGERAVSVERLAELAAFYGVGTWAMVPEWPPSRAVSGPVSRSEPDAPSGTPEDSRALDGRTAAVDGEAA